MSGTLWGDLPLEAVKDANGNTVGLSDGVTALPFGHAKFEHSDGVLLSSCSTSVGCSVIGAGVTVTAVPVNIPGFKTGTSLMVTIPVGVTGSVTIPAFTASNIQSGVFGFVMDQQSKDLTRAGAIYFGDTSFANSWRADPTMNRTGLMTFAFSSGEVAVNAGTPVKTGITNFKFLVNNTTGTEAYVALLHGVYGGMAIKPSVNIVIDDGIVSAYTEWLPILNSYGYNATFSIIKDLINTGGYLTPAQLAALYAAGNDLAPHGQFNLSTYATVALALADIANNADYLLGLGYTRGSDYYVYPNGVYAYSATDRDSIKNFLASRGMRAAYLAALEGVSYGNIKIDGCGRYHMPRIYLDATHTAATALGLIDTYVASGRSCTIMAHDVVASGAVNDKTNRSDVIALLDGLKTRENAGSLDVIVGSELHRRMGL